MRKIIKFLMTLYLKIVNLFRKITLPRHYLSNYSLNITAFEDLINSYPYKMDPLGGAWDYIVDPDDLLLNNILIKAYETAKKYNLDIYCIIILKLGIYFIMEKQGI